MLNTEINEFAAQSNLTQVASYFDVIDTAVKTGDTNKRYNISTNACNAPSAPIQNGGWTSLTFSPTCDNMVDLYNSFITATMNITLKFANDLPAAFTSQDGTLNPCIWIGFKDAMDAISQYQILANGQSIYTQSNAIEESYITSLASTEGVKKVDVFSKTRFADVWKGKDTCSLGDYINIKPKPGDSSINTYGLTIDLKIDLRRFLPLNSIRMLPAFVGNMELRLKFSTEGLVCAAVPLDYLANSPLNLNKCNKYPAITNKFVPINETLTYINRLSYASNAFTVDTGTNSASVLDMNVNPCASHLACFGLDDNLYQSLVQRYMNESLSFPIQTLSFQGMNGKPNEKTIDLVLTSTPRFVDSIYILLQKNQNYRTCYENPLFETFSLKMGGYGVIPDLPITSYGPAYYEMASNAFNTNNDTTGFNVDVMKSLINNMNSQTGIYPKDITNFVLAFPASTDFTYQQGQTSSTPITYQLKSQFSSDPNSDVSPYKSDDACIPLMGFLKDSVLAIQLRPSGPPIIAIDEYDITSPAE